MSRARESKDRGSKRMMWQNKTGQPGRIAVMELTINIFIYLWLFDFKICNGEGSFEPKVFKLTIFTHPSTEFNADRACVQHQLISHLPTWLFLPEAMAGALVGVLKPGRMSMFGTLLVIWGPVKERKGS
ncbi:hypothetical protein GH714_023952 [Hevea brasiliensis]|uniref:Uncharacterized protein n=1 Tax=Hevea brasiliensis TaxID=3981 RepID=A0A6A6LS74_HEVBR|nr:hypothetical protein GH714_023952 [Hevea brasiliensis]